MLKWSWSKATGEPAGRHRGSSTHTASTCTGSALEVFRRWSGACRAIKNIRRLTPKVEAPYGARNGASPDGRPAVLAGELAGESNFRSDAGQLLPA